MKEDVSNYIHSSISAKYARFLQPEVYTKEEEIHKFMVNLEILAEMETKTDMRFMN